MKIKIETGGDEVFCGEDCPFNYSYSNRFSYECEYFRNTSGEWRKLRTKEGQPKRCKPCVESLVAK